MRWNKVTLVECRCLVDLNECAIRRTISHSFRQIFSLQHWQAPSGNPQKSQTLWESTALEDMAENGPASFFPENDRNTHVSLKMNVFP